MKVSQQLVEAFHILTKLSNFIKLKLRIKRQQGILSSWEVFFKDNRPNQCMPHFYFYYMNRGYTLFLHFGFFSNKANKKQLHEHLVSDMKMLYFEHTKILKKCSSNITQNPLNPPNTTNATPLKQFSAFFNRYIYSKYI